MRPFRQRLIIVLWALWAAYATVSIMFLIESVIGNTPPTETFPRPKQADSYAVTVPETVINAYRNGAMSKNDRQQFERDLQTGLITIPSATPITVKKSYWPAISEQLGNAAFLLLSPVFFLMLFQYLVIGHASPIRLARGVPLPPGAGQR
jgi:hypothetical protein